ncbi:MAG: phosphotriesterase-related protein [Acidobacteriota bacterium]|nr:phosphotriesterase-related protein [Acidobacteriota bacterium]
MGHYPFRSSGITRRDAVRQLGAAGIGIVTVKELGRGVQAAGRQDPRGVTFPEGAIIRTVLRDVRPQELASGTTLFHEHLSIGDPRPPWLPSEDSLAGVVGPTPFSADLDLMADEVNATGQEGVICIVNGGTKDLGQNFERLRQLAERTDVHIVMAGGLWTQPRYPPEIAGQTVQQVAADFERDATAERWGAIGEIGSSMTMHPDERKVLQASCLVHQRTGLPLFTHTPHQGCKACAVEQLDIIERMGVDPRLVAIGHLADITDDPRAETHIALARRGAFLGFDTVGHQITQGDAKKLEMIMAVIDAGLEDHVLLSADFAREAELKANGGAGYSSVPAIFVPKMRFAGVPEETIQKILVDNPRRFLAFSPKGA